MLTSLETTIVLGHDHHFILAIASSGSKLLGSHDVCAGMRKSDVLRKVSSQLELNEN